MKRNTLNFYVDLASFLVLFALLLTGLLIHYILPPCGNCDGTPRRLWNGQFFGIGR